MSTIKMRKVDWQKWDSALRSGEYKQGKRVLEKDGMFCCLGVLQHCLTGKTQKDETDPDGHRCLNPTVSWLEEHGITFSGGSSRKSPMLPKLGLVACAANDDGVTFVEIADAIQDCVEFTDEVMP